MEGSYTWFGLTDYRSRLKPSYYALKELWTNEKTELLPQHSITAPAKIEAGNEYTYTASTDNKNHTGLKYEWHLLKDEYLDEVDNINSTDNTASIRLKIPKQPSNYRLYLYVSDEKGNVTTASVPVPVK